MVLVALTLGIATGVNAQAQGEPESYFLFLKDESMTWCGFRNSDEFQAEAKKFTPSKSAKATFTENRLLDVTYQLNAQSGDWIVVDNYVLVGDGAVLHRENLFAEGGIRVTQEAGIHQGAIDPFRIINAIRADGREVDLSVVDFPQVEVKANPSELPFMQVIHDMQSRPADMLCESL